MKALQVISRILVGALFVVSGLIKANDTVGFSFKLAEYFEVFGMEFLEPMALPLAMIIVVLEIMLGVATLFGSKMKLISWSLLLMIVGFTFLTFYSAYFNKVTDCGCFGDAIKLTPWQSFWKDVVLLALILVIFFKRNAIRRNTYMDDLTVFPISVMLIAIFALEVLNWPFPMIFVLILFPILLFFKNYLKSDDKDWLLALITMLASVVFVYHTYAHLPIKDYRAYKVGNNIPKLMEIPEGASQGVYETVIYYENLQSGEVKGFKANEIPWRDSLTWKWHHTHNVEIEAPYEPPIHDFELMDADGNDYTEDVFAEPLIFLVVAHDLSKSHEAAFVKIGEFLKEANNIGIYSYVLSSSNQEAYEKVQTATGIEADLLTVDQTALKTMIRSNPGIVLLESGMIANKWHYNDLPSFNEIAPELKEKIESYNAQ